MNALYKRTNTHTVCLFFLLPFLIYALHLRYKFLSDFRWFKSVTRFGVGRKKQKKKNQENPRFNMNETSYTLRVNELHLQPNKNVNNATQKLYAALNNNRLTTPTMTHRIFSVCRNFLISKSMHVNGFILFCFFFTNNAAYFENRLNLTFLWLGNCICSIVIVLKNKKK